MSEFIGNLLFKCWVVIFKNVFLIEFLKEVSNYIFLLVIKYKEIMLSKI